MRAGQRVLVGLLLVAAAGRAAADAYVSQVRYVYDRHGRQAGAVVLIQTDHSAWRFNLSRQLLSMPTARLAAVLDNQFNLGQDRDIVSGVLDSMQQSRQQAAVQQGIDAQRQAMDALNQMQQQQQMLDQINQQRAEQQRIQGEIERQTQQANQQAQQQEIINQINSQIQELNRQQQIQDAINRANQQPFVPPPPPAPYIPPPPPHFP